MSEAGVTEIQKDKEAQAAEALARASVWSHIPWAGLACLRCWQRFCIVFGNINPNFWSEVNLANVSRQISILALVSIGQTFAILSGSIDLSVGSLLALVSIVCAQAMLEFGLVGGIVAGILGGVVSGAVTGFLIAKAKLRPFIGTRALGENVLRDSGRNDIRCSAALRYW